MKFVTIKTSDEAHRLLKQIAARTGEKMYALMQRLLRAEAKRLDKRS